MGLMAHVKHTLFLLAFLGAVQGKTVCTEHLNQISQSTSLRTTKGNDRYLYQGTSLSFPFCAC